LIVAERGFLDRPVTVEAVDTMAEPVKLNIRPGETYTRIELLRALLVKSPNDVARCLARDAAGSVENFAELMNQKARELGAMHSHFVNPNGLPIPGQYSSARDLSIIAKAAYANGTIRSIVCLPQLVFRYANGRTRELENTNKVLKRLAYCNGMKTGYTEAAGHCLIASGARPGRDIIVVVLGDSKSGVWQDASALLSWGLSWDSGTGTEHGTGLTVFGSQGERRFHLFGSQLVWAAQIVNGRAFVSRRKPEHGYAIVSLGTGRVLRTVRGLDVPLVLTGPGAPFYG